MDRPQLIAVSLVLLLVLLGAWLETKWRKLRERKQARDAVRRGAQGERDAEKLLKKLGYTVISRHPPASYGMLVDGEPQAVQLAADFVLELKGKRVIAEVKTGKAAKLEHPETRRQLLEYQLAFGVDTLLLVDVEAKQVRTVRFPLPKKKAAATPGKRTTMRWATIALIGLGAAWLLAGGEHERSPSEQRARPGLP